MLLPYGGLSISDGGTTTQALTTAAGKVVAWGQASSSNSDSVDGDPAVKPDLANNRLLLNCPGIYLVSVDVTMLGASTTQDVIVQLRKNLVAIPDGSARCACVSTARNVASFTCIVTITANDNPKNIQTFPDPVNPPSKFTGAGGAPTTLVPLDITLATVASTATATLEAAHLNAIRIG